MRRITPIAPVLVAFSATVFVFASCAHQPADPPGGDGDDGTGGTSPGLGGAAGTAPVGGASQGGAAPSGGNAGLGGTTPGVGGTPSTGGSGGAGTPGTGGATAGGAGAAGTAGAGGMTTTCMPNPPPQNCSGMAAPTDGVMIDFATWQTSGAWGVSAMGDITGGTSYYQGRGVTPLTAVVEAGTGLRITGSLPAYTPTVADDAENYAGIVFWFGPCVNASAFTGLSVNVGGTLTGAVMKLQVQTHLDYPVDVANTKGACVFTNCDTRWSECVGPTATVAVPSSPAAMPWATFLNGKPMMNVTPEGLVGLQFQFECQAESACTVDASLGTITLTM